MSVLTRPRIFTSIIRWFDCHATEPIDPSKDPHRIDWVQSSPFFFMHIMCLGVLWVGWSSTAVAVAVALYILRMFAITGFYHRYFSHRAFRTTRTCQFIFALAGATAVQRGPLWWAAHHRTHHRYSDKKQDLHSPHHTGFWWSQIGWLTSKQNFATKHNLVGDFSKFPELQFLNRFDTMVPFLFAVSVFGFGELLHAYAPGLGTNGMQMLIWGFFISTVVLLHGTSTINSLSHLLGKKRYDTHDESRNNPYLAIITLGEGWHNNHHHYASSARQGFFWWEIDITYYGLVVLSWLGLIWDLRPVPSQYLYAHHLKKEAV